MSEAIEKSTNLFVEPERVNKLSECFFYHSMDLPSYGNVEGQWDLRGHEAQYLGNVPLFGKRVLEIGPASGHVTFFMEKEGAQVVSVEAAEDYQWEFCWDIPDKTPSELFEKLVEHRDMMRRLRNSYWLAHAEFNSKARVHYGSAYSIPSTLGLFDISVIGCVLLHCKNPLQILENCVRLTGETVVVVEVFRGDQLTQSAAVFQPTANDHTWHTWWSFSPVYFVDILRSMGFPHHRVTFHHQNWLGSPKGLFTVVASRNPLTEINTNAVPVEVKLSTIVESLKIQSGSLVKIPVAITNNGKVPLSISPADPVLLCYHWKNARGELLVWDGLRTPLLRTLYPNDRDDLFLSVLAPSEAGEYFLDLTLLQENVTWYDDLVPGLTHQIKTTVI